MKEETRLTVYSDKPIDRLFKFFRNIGVNAYNFVFVQSPKPLVESRASAFTKNELEILNNDIIKFLNEAKKEERASEVSESKELERTEDEEIVPSTNANVIDVAPRNVDDVPLDTSSRLGPTVEKHNLAMRIGEGLDAKPNKNHNRPKGKVKKHTNDKGVEK